jgi:hypothetical protein
MGGQLTAINFSAHLSTLYRSCSIQAPCVTPSSDPAKSNRSELQREVRLLSEAALAAVSLLSL